MATRPSTTIVIVRLWSIRMRYKRVNHIPRTTNRGVESMILIPDCFKKDIFLFHPTTAVHASVFFSINKYELLKSDEDYWIAVYIHAVPNITQPRGQYNHYILRPCTRLKIIREIIGVYKIPGYTAIVIVYKSFKINFWSINPYNIYIYTI